MIKSKLETEIIVVAKNLRRIVILQKFECTVVHSQGALTWVNFGQKIQNLLLVNNNSITDTEQYSSLSNKLNDTHNIGYYYVYGVPYQCQYYTDKAVSGFR